MRSAKQSVRASSKGPWVGRTISALVVLFLLFDSVGKLFKRDSVVEWHVDLGYPESRVVAIGIILLACIIVYVIPRTAFLGVILLTGYLGGATATQVRTEASLFRELFPVVIGVAAWGGLVLRDARLPPILFGPRPAKREGQTLVLGH